MIIIVYAVHSLVCFALIVIVLLQTGKGADMGSAFGGASQTVFGTSGRQTFLSRLTVGAAVTFMVTCLFLAWYSSKTVSRGVMKDFQEGPPAGAQGSAPLTGAPAQPPGPAPAPTPGPAAPAAPSQPGPKPIGNQALPTDTAPAPAQAIPSRPAPGGPQAAPSPPGPSAPAAPEKPAPKGAPGQLP